MKRNKFAALLLVMILTVTMVATGCKKSEQESSTSNGTETNETTETNEATVVEFWHGYSADKADVLKEMVTKYETENPNVKIDAKFVAAGEEMLQKVQAAILSDELPDMLWGYPTWTGVLESSGKLAEVGALLDEEQKKDIPEGLLNAGKYKGKVYSLPIEAGTLYLIYNKDMFAEKGIENPPTTWDELYEVSKQLTEDERFGVWLPIAPDERTSWTWECFLWQNGQDLLDDQYTGITFDNDKGLEALEFYTKMIKEGYAPVSVGQDPFIDKQVAMVYATQGAANAYINKYDMNVGVAMLPGKDQKATGLGSNHYFMFKSEDKVQEETLKFMKWMTTGENHAEWAIKTGYLPVSNSARESEKYKKYGEENAHMQTAAEALTYGIARPPIEEYPKLSAVISATIEKIAYGEITAKEGMDNITKEAEKIFSK